MQDEIDGMKTLLVQKDEAILQKDETILQKDEALLQKDEEIKRLKQLLKKTSSDWFAFASLFMRILGSKRVLPPTSLWVIG